LSAEYVRPLRRTAAHGRDAHATCYPALVGYQSRRYYHRPISLLRSILADPRTRGLDIDDPRTTVLRRAIIRDKKFLFRIYDEWYRLIAADVPDRDEPTLELGSGAGFLKDYIPRLITSEIFPIPGVDIVLDGQRLPFADASLRAIVMTDVLHHIPRVRDFLRESARCITPGGAIVMTEPWVTPWSKFIYRNFHHEPFEPGATTWEFPATGPLSGANGALPWILFHRDREIFQREFPQWRIESIVPLMPLRYLLSGGVTLRTLVPNFSYPLWRALDHLLATRMAMFAKIVLRRVQSAP
jgi:SAM-dependent methyltransferase